MAESVQGPQEGGLNRAPLSALPSYGDYLSPHGEIFECSGCHFQSPLVRSYSLLNVVLLPFALAWRQDFVMKCPGCMRNHILLRLPVAILLSNLMSPLVVVWWLAAFVRTFFSRPG